MDTVELSNPEMWMAGQTGLARWLNARKQKRTPVNGHDIYIAAADDIVGAMAEAAVAKAFNRYWLGEWQTGNVGKDRDVDGLQVRHTRYPAGKLLIQKNDHDQSLYVLVVGMPPLFRIAGWMQAMIGKQDRFWDSKLPRPCFAVPQDELQPMEKLPDYYQEIG